MMTPAFSTVACPSLTLEAVFELAASSGFPAVELRTFGDASRSFACDPALTAPEKTRAWAERSGVALAMLGTGRRFDAPIVPPVIGNVFGDPDRPAREAKHDVDLAASLECPLVRVFAFESPAAERPAATVERIAHRLTQLADHAHRTGVRIALENGGSFCRAAEIATIIDAVNSPLLGACLNIAVSSAAGDSPAAAINALGPRLFSVRIKDLRAGRPVPLGEGDVPLRAAIDALRARGFSGPVVFEHDAAWLPGLDAAAAALPAAARTLFDCIGPAVRPATRAAARA
jgi:sugar phosphate isomerase/epimerase